MASYSLRRISASEFVKRLQLACSREGETSGTDKRYAFFLGAGCSVSSGIPTAGELVKASDQEKTTDWLRRYHDLTESHKANDEKALDAWAKKTLRTWSPQSPASSYGELLELLFHTPGERQREIERICTGKTPNFGYIVLSSLMSLPGAHFNIVLSTNFDDLLAEAFFHFQALRLMIINHDSLAPFIRPTQTRPLLIKLHGDHRLSPRNTAAETSMLDSIVAERVSTVLHDRGLVFVGYGGNDESILRMLEKLPDEALPFGVYWVSSNEPRGTFRRWLEKRDAIWVEHQDFDELMLLLSRELALPEPSNTHINTALGLYQKTRESLVRRLTSRTQENSEIQDAGAWFLNEFARQIARQDMKLSDSLYKAAINASPKDARLLGNYANFLSDVRNNYDEAEKYYRLAIESDPKLPGVLANYAIFLADVRKNPDEAETYHRRAIAADPKGATCLGNYANFLAEHRKKYDEAEQYYLRAIDADPKEVNCLRNYANFLVRVRKDFDQAEKYFLLAVEAAPKHPGILGTYANFLAEYRENPDEADRYYLLAIDADPKAAKCLANYANFLAHVRKDFDEAEKYYLRALEVDPLNSIILGNYAVFLGDVRSNIDEAEKYHIRATESDPKGAKILCNFANFLAYNRKNPGEAEKYYVRAIEADSTNSILFGNYANFLYDIRKNPDEAEKYYLLAIQHGPENAIVLVNYANFLTREQRDIDEADKYYLRAVEMAPKKSGILGTYAMFLAGVRKDYDAAEKYLLRAIEVSPRDAAQLGNYANFLAEVRKQPDAAETFYLRAMKAGLRDPNSICNYAGLLLGKGEIDEGLKLLQLVSSNSDEGDVSAVAVELAFYRYALGPKTERSENLTKLKVLILRGSRSNGWDFSKIVAQATTHPARRWLAKLALVCNGSAVEETLERWKAWREA